MTLRHRTREHLAAPPNLTPLERETRVSVNTSTAAAHLSRRPQTLRLWAVDGGPITPRRVKGRLAWSVADIKTLLGA